MEADSHLRFRFNVGFYISHNACLDVLKTKLGYSDVIRCLWEELSSSVIVMIPQALYVEE